MKFIFYSLMFYLINSYTVNAKTKQTQLQLLFESENFIAFSDQERNDKIESIKRKLLEDNNLDTEQKSVEIFLIDYLFLAEKNYSTIKTKRLIHLFYGSKVKDKYLLNTIKYHLARNILEISPKRSYKLNLEVLSYARKNNFITLEISCLELYVGIVKNNSEFQKSAKLYSQIISLLKRPSNFKVSMLNNLSNVFVKLKKYNRALFFNQLATNELKLFKTKKDLVTEYLLNLLIANKGEIYFNLKKYNIVKQNLKTYYNFIKRHPEYNEHAPNILWVLYQTFQITKNIKEKKEIKNYLNDYFKREIDLSKKWSASNILKEICLLENEFIMAYKWDKILNELTDRKQKIISNSANEINEELLSFSIYNINKKNQLEDYLNAKKITWFIVILSLFVTSLFLLFFNRYQVQRKKLEISTLKQQNVLQEITIRDSKINELQMYVELKNTMNKIFVEKIKSLRKRKEISSEQLLKELQMQLSNLLQIDKNNIPLTVLSENEKNDFYDILLTQNPSLSRIELELCGYLRLNLSSKEIASILNLSDGSVRVYKTRLKEKLNISRDVSVEKHIKKLLEDHSQKNLG